MTFQMLQSNGFLEPKNIVVTHCKYTDKKYFYIVLDNNSVFCITDTHICNINGLDKCMKNSKETIITVYKPNTATEEKYIDINDDTNLNIIWKNQHY